MGILNRYAEDTLYSDDETTPMLLRGNDRKKVTPKSDGLTMPLILRGSLDDEPNTEGERG